MAELGRTGVANRTFTRRQYLTISYPTVRDVDTVDFIIRGPSTFHGGSRDGEGSTDRITKQSVYILLPGLT